MRRTILTIAGSDSSGGAGIQADLKAIAANGGYGASVITAITAQNTRGVVSAETVSVALVTAQLDAVFDDLDVAAVKTGMLATAEIIEAVADHLRERRLEHYVCDPVMISKTGFALLANDAVNALEKRLLPLASLVTPNVHEAGRLASRPVDSIRSAEEAGRRILETGVRAVLVKGGHLPDRPGVDVLVDESGVRHFETAWIDTPHTHGTGCTFSAAIAAHLGAGAALVPAIERAKRFLTAALEAGRPVGKGVSPPDPFHFLRPEGPERS